MHRHADVVPAVGLLVHTEVVARGRQLRQREVLERATQTALDPCTQPFRPDVVDHELEP